ncbi:MAG TPA: rod shape-determining protein MreC [Thermoanaerobaculia bacterium]
MDERRTGWVLLLVLATQLVVLTFRVPGAASSSTLLGGFVLRILGPVARAVAATGETFTVTRDDVALRDRLIRENRGLRREVEELKLRLLRFDDLGGEMARLGDAVQYAASPMGEIRAADVVYVDHASWLRTLVLYSGKVAARVNQPVLSPAGLVGRVVLVAGPYAKVQLITDRAAAVGGMDLRNRRQGVVRGSGDVSDSLDFDYVPLQAEIRPGDRVVTAGIDGVYPRGVPVGTVAAVEPGGQLFHRIRMVPAVDFGTLDQVYLLDHLPVPGEVEKAIPGARRR